VRPMIANRMYSCIAKLSIRARALDYAPAGLTQPLEVSRR